MSYSSLPSALFSLVISMALVLTGLLSYFQALLLPYTYQGSIDKDEVEWEIGISENLPTVILIK